MSTKVDNMATPKTKYEYVKLSEEGIVEGILYRNTKSIYQPSYNLDHGNGIIVNITATPAKQLKDIEKDVLGHYVIITLVRKHSDTYNKDYLRIADLKIVDKPKTPIQRKLEVQHVTE